MPGAPSPPNVPPLDGWVCVDDTTDRLFEFGLVSVVARTVVYEDRTIRERVPAAADGPWRFFFASRLTIRPHTPPSSALTRLVDHRATSGFESRLRNRGFSDLSHAETRSLAVAVGEATVHRYDATVSLAGVRLAAVASLAIAPVDGEFLLIGGAYPREILGGDGETAAVLRTALDPTRFREELFDVIRTTD
ncbi:DUF6517 family protein [Haloferax sp. S1W]|uniref:DUF6517 family protein n=1 Tax=Haloferax sp. S1W TaxID=3377110 RepID=UPI0037C7771E